jgi:hypothetical protein
MLDLSLEPHGADLDFKYDPAWFEGITPLTPPLPPTPTLPPAVTPPVMSTQPLPAPSPCRSPTLPSSALLLSAAFPLARPVNGRRSCANTNCGKLARSTAYTKAMCKLCCMANKTRVCSYRKHHDTAAITAGSGDPSELARPPPPVPGISILVLLTTAVRWHTTAGCLTERSGGFPRFP